MPQPFTRLRNDETVCHSERLRERIRNTLKGETDCRGAKAPRNDKEARKRIATAVYVSPAGSVGASASQRCPPDTRTFAMTKRYVILSACAKESVIPLGEKRIAAGLKPLAMTERQFTAHPVTFTATNQLVILSACAKESVISLKRERIAAGLKPLAMTRRRENGLPQPFTRLRNDKKTGCICSPFNNLFSHAKAAEYFICYLVCNAPAGKLKQGGQRVVHANAHRV